MPQLSIDDRIRTIRSYELDPPTQEIRRLGVKFAEPTTDDKSAYVDDGSLVSFVAGVSPQHQKDGLNSTLLAQLVANKKYDREKQTEDWYKQYREVLETVGWVVGDFKFTKFRASGATFDVNEVVLKLLEAIATGNDIAIVAETIEALKALSDDDGRVVLFNTESHAFGKGNFQIAVAAESDGVLVMKIGAMYFSTSDNVTRVLWFRFSSSSSDFYQGSQTINLNEDVYGRVRQAVIDKLGDNAETKVGEFEI